MNAEKIIYPLKSNRFNRRVLYALLIALVLFLLLPWTQNIRVRGTVTTLRLENRPQSIYTIIGGKIVKWHVREGDNVKKGDTLLQLGEIKDAYLDSQLIDRTAEQLLAKEKSIMYYGKKVAANAQQIEALTNAQSLKIRQLENKITQLTLKIKSDSVELIASNNDLKIADAQYKRQQIMRDSGVSSLIQLEQRNQSYQTAIAKKTSAEIKFTNSKTDLLNAKIELSQTVQEYTEKLMKAEGEQASIQSDIANSQAEVSKLTNVYANYNIRNGQYYIFAPQDGQVVGARKSGLLELVKEGEQLLSIVPKRQDKALELFVAPMDLPLLKEGQKVSFIFDGFPAILFSGWPKASVGIFRGQILFIEKSIQENGKYRILVTPDNSSKAWPQMLAIGTGASAVALLNDVPIWYELWRNINGFPADYYQQKKKTKHEK
jgi:multidrug efflux pump subunit AcrA (membrane-fusion protein)